MNDVYMARSSAVAARGLEEELVILSMEDSTLFTLNETGAEIWSAADGRTPLREVVRSGICVKFAVEQDAAYEDAEAFCRQLSERGILAISDRPIEPEG